MPYLVVIIERTGRPYVPLPERSGSFRGLVGADVQKPVGIHLVLSTQRPSVEVVTGLVDANITSRIPLQVASQIDSRTIIDMVRRGKLLSHGDMLY